MYLEELVFVKKLPWPSKCQAKAAKTALSEWHHAWEGKAFQTDLAFTRIRSFYPSMKQGERLVISFSSRYLRSWLPSTQISFTGPAICRLSLHEITCLKALFIWRSERSCANISHIIEENEYINH